MKNLKNKLSYTLAIVVTVLFISCSAEDGAIGPMGGDGKDGDNGKDGNANVTSVIIENINLERFTYKDFTTNIITQDILDSGVVLAFVQKPSQKVTAWWSLPFYNNAGSNDRIDLAFIWLNKIRLIATYKPSVLNLKIVAIAGNSANASKNSKSNILSSLENNGIDVNDYNQVAKYYNLEE